MSGNAPATEFRRKSSGLVREIPARSAFASNLVAMGVVVNIWWIVWASLLYPGADLPTTVWLALVLNLIIAYVYWMLSTAIPRTGGDYVYVSRIFHPMLGFMVNFMIVIIMITWMGMWSQLSAAYFIPTILINLAKSTGNQAYLGPVAWMTSINGQFITGFVITTICIAVMLLPSKWIFNILLADFAVQAIVYVWFLAVVAPVSHAAFVQAFNAQSGTTVQTILNVASTQGGVDWSITTYGTLIGIIYTMLAFMGYANSAYFAGELKGDPKKSQGLAIFISPVIFGVVIWILYTVCENTFGHDFLVAASSVALSSTPSISAAWTNTLATIPTPAYLVSFISNNPVFLAAVPFSLLLTAFGFNITYYFVPVRNIFAWAFDRTIPMKFAEVDHRGVPWIATLVYGGLGYLSLYLAVYTSVFSYFTYSTFGWFVAVAIVMFAAAVFPWRSQGIYDSAPKIVKMKVGPVPLITILGLLGGVLCASVAYISLIPIFTGMEINPYYIVFMLLVFVVAALIYVSSYLYHKSKGVPIELLGKELPPV
jgi:amino acid transporter